jgi:hypothetical protein
MKFFLLLISVVFTAILCSCRKEKPFVVDEDPVSQNKSSIDGFDRSIRYDATHDVLMFESFSDIGRLERAIYDYSHNYPFDRGNRDILMSKMDIIQNDGYARGNGNNGGENLSDFEILLSESFPLSDEVLAALINLNDHINPGFSPPFMRTVLSQNVPFSEPILERIVNSEIPEGIKEQIMDANYAVHVVPDYAFNDFLDLYPSFNSLYEIHESDEAAKLQSGMDPLSPEFNNDFIGDRF